MKRIIIIALALVAGAVVTVCPAKDKKNKKNLPAVQAPVTLTNASDSLSYAAGMAATKGLKDYLKRLYGVDSTMTDDVLRGFDEATRRTGDASYKAFLGGEQIGLQAKKQIIEGFRKELKGSKENLSEELFLRGFRDAIADDHTHFANSEAEQYTDKKILAAKDAAKRKYKEDNALWLKENAVKEGVVTTPSGLQYKVLTKGEGTVPKSDEQVTVKYEGRLIDGTVFDSSYKRNPQTSDFKPSQVIKGWTEALTTMPRGSKWELYIPQELGYGSRQAGKIPPYSTLIFVVELVK